MKLSQALCALIFLLVPVASSSSNTSALLDTCKSLASACPWDRGYDYCLKFFQADKGSTTADKHGLAVIATKIIATTAKSTVKHIDTLKASETDKKRLGCLSACAELYTDVVNQTGEVLKGITSGRAEGLQDAMTVLYMVLDAPNTCDEGFYEKGEKSLLQMEDIDFEEVVGLAICVVSALLPSS